MYIQHITHIPILHLFDYYHYHCYDYDYDFSKRPFSKSLGPGGLILRTRIDRHHGRARTALLVIIVVIFIIIINTMCLLLSIIFGTSSGSSSSSSSRSSSSSSSRSSSSSSSSSSSNSSSGCTRLLAPANGLFRRAHQACILRETASERTRTPGPQSKNRKVWGLDQRIVLFLRAAFPPDTGKPPNFPNGDSRLCGRSLCGFAVSPARVGAPEEWPGPATYILYISLSICIYLYTLTYSVCIYTYIHMSYLSLYISIYTQRSYRSYVKI